SSRVLIGRAPRAPHTLGVVTSVRLGSTDCARSGEELTPLFADRLASTHLLTAVQRFDCDRGYRFRPSPRCRRGDTESRTPRGGLHPTHGKTRPTGRRLQPETLMAPFEFVRRRES